MNFAHEPKSFCILYLEIPGNGECQSEQERKRKRQRKREKRRYWGIPWHICFRSSARAGSCSYGATPLEGLLRWLFSPDGATCNIDVPVPGPFSWEFLRDMGMSDIHTCVRIVLRKCTFKLRKLTIRVYCSTLTSLPNPIYDVKVIVCICVNFWIYIRFLSGNPQVGS